MPSRSVVSSAVALLASASLFGAAVAQVHTDCNPMQKDCPPNPAFGIAHNFVFNKSQPAWDTTVGPVTYDDENGATFTIAKQGESPTIRTQQYIFFGRVEIIMKASPGRGIISSVMLLSDNLDEIDWEFLGINNTMALTNYFGKGSDDFTNGKEIVVPGGPVQNEFHNYTIDWTKERLHWMINGNIVRTLTPADAKNGERYPQTPCRLSLGIWAGSDPRLAQGTREWAGGDTDFSKGPFSMHVKSTYIKDYSSGKEYAFSDRSGSYQSIKIVEGESPANKTITEANTVSPTISERWASLTSGQKTGVYVGSASFVAIVAGAFLWYFLKQRRRGKEEARLAAEREKREQMELNQFHAAGIDPDSFTVQHADGNGNPFATPAQSIHEKHGMHGSVAAVGAGAAAAPLLHNGSRTPHTPGMNDGQQQQYFDQSPNSGGMRSPSGPAARYATGHGGPPRGPPSPGLGSPGGYPHPDRSATAPVNRMNSPGPMNGPQRSLTNDSYRGPGGHPQQGNNGWR
ncbi:hypothetical protein PspLS_07697 [Pyricularia sp. CBS 133598]|nr:hypothetical protein PspLS_07697 [Pyricularia sp. CBS 133598]